MIKRFFQLTKSYYDVVTGKVDLNSDVLSNNKSDTWYNVTPNEYTTDMGNSTTTLGYKDN